jgi:hypothetical protein
MAERPFLFFQPPVTADRSKLGGGGAKYTKPTAAQQAARLEARFVAIVDAFQALQANVAGLVPEQVVVLETLTTAVDGVAKAASRIPGLEWLAEIDLEDQTPEFGFADAEEREAAVSRRLYALMSNQQAMNSLVDLWHQWVKAPAQRAKQGFGPFKHLFELLKDIRHWSPEDRIRETGILDRWREHADIGATMRFEVEFWYRSLPANRAAAFADMLVGLLEVGGTVLDQAVIDGINYHAALVEVPGTAVQQFVHDVNEGTYSRVLRSEGVMFFRPRAQAAFGIAEIEPVAFDLAARLEGQQAVAGPPTVAVFDGLPLSGHTAVVGRIVIDDPDGFAASYQVRQMQHGTAMASTVIHGDLHDSGRALSAPVYVRPILEPDAFGGQTEITPPTRLLVDVVHRAFRRLFVPEAGQPAAAPAVRIVNLSIGDPSQPFDRTLSPLARLLDWLAWEYRLLIVVSIGNHHTVRIAFDPAWTAWSDAERVHQLLRGMRSTQIHRRPLSPSEAINCLSVGAAHVDHAEGFDLGDRVDLSKDVSGPSPLSTVAQGFRRSTKPEVLFPGGRLLHRPNPVAEGIVTFDAVDTTLAPGVLAATPGVAPMELGRVKYSCGSSNAAALATRCAALALEALGNTEIPADVGALDANVVAVVLKALVVHGASWGDAKALIEAAFPDAADDWRQMSRLKQQFLGYGLVDISRAVASSERRATILGWGQITREQARTYRLPLPPSLAASTELRRVTATLAWLSPANYRHQNYRRAQLWLSITGINLATAVQGLDAQAARRGTVEHRIWQGEHAVPFTDGATMQISVNCKDDAGKLDVAVPYAIAVSLEVGVNSNVEVYEEVRSRIRPAVAVVAAP